MPKILIADDDPAILDSVSMMLSLEGYEVATTVDGETIYKMEKEAPDLLLLDILMSGQDGREICKFLKNNPLTKRIPIILVSASRDVKGSAELAGADGFLEKPFEMDEILEVISRHLLIVDA